MKTSVRIFLEALSKTMVSEVPIVRQQRDSNSSGLFRDSEAWNNDLGNGFRCSNRPPLHLNAFDIEIKTENLVKSTFWPIVSLRSIFTYRLVETIRLSTILFYKANIIPLSLYTLLGNKYIATVVIQYALLQWKWSLYIAYKNSSGGL